ncbi:MAG: hypothetical protein WKG01_05920 [Kofleriaceae bacterium]
MLDEISYQAALAEAERGKSTREDDSWSRQLGEMLDVRVAELRRNLLPAPAPIEKARPIRKSLLVLGRDALVERITELTQRMGGAVQYAHRDLRGLSDDDLRRLLDMIDPAPREAE